MTTPSAGWGAQRVFWRRWALWGARVGPEPWLRYSPALFGFLFALVSRKQRKMIKYHVRTALGRLPWWSEQRAILATFINYAHCFAEALALGRFEPTIVVEGEQWLATLGSGGWVALTAHLGPWEAAAHCLGAAVNRPVTLVMADEPDREAQALSDAVREHAGLCIAAVGRDPLGALGLLQQLRSGGVVAGQMDRVPQGCRSRAIQVEQSQYLLPEGLLRLAAASEVAAVPIFCAREGFFRYRVEIGEPLWPATSAAALQDAFTRYGRALHAAIRANPTQWFQFSA